MHPKDAFLNKLGGDEPRFGTYNDKTIGMLVVNLCFSYMYINFNVPFLLGLMPILSLFSTMACYETIVSYLIRIKTLSFYYFLQCHVIKL